MRYECGKALAFDSVEEILNYDHSKESWLNLVTDGFGLRFTKYSLKRHCHAVVAPL